MKFAILAALTIAVGTVGTAQADPLQSAFASVAGNLQSQGGGLAPLYAACPKTNSDGWEYLSSALFVPMTASDSAVLLNTGMCGGGNGSGQHLILIKPGAAHIVTNAGIGDMSFLASNAYYFDGVLTLHGNRWLPNDPHCCPSKKANLEFNMKTGTHKLTIVDRDN